MDFSERLRVARNHAKLTQVKLGQLSGVTQQTINKLETGKSKSTSAVVAMATACGVRAEWLSREDGPMLRSTIADDAEILRLAAMIHSLPAGDRAHLQAVTDAFIESRALRDRKKAG